MREDIQCLRGIAIIFVFIYHLYPTLFVNGFLGVDVFFVISGYLMGRSLVQKKIARVQDILKFYFRRFKRILPLYYFAIFLTVIMVQIFLGEFWWKTNKRYSMASLFMVTNMLIIHDSGDYFLEFLTDGSSMNAFIHFWSLGVEMQFYLLAPFIFIALQFLKSDFLRLLAGCLTIIIGCTAFLIINFQFSFNFMLLRLWQFSAGYTVVFWEKVRMSEKALMDEKYPEKRSTEDSITLAVNVLLMCLIPYKLEVNVFRPLVTFAAMFLIANRANNIQILKSKTLIYLGNISYVIYLLHWPIIVVFGGPSYASRLFCIVSTMTLSAFVHYIYEKQYLKLKMKPVLVLIAVFIIMNALLQISISHQKFWKPHYSSEIREVIDKNQMSLNWSNKPFADECIHNPEEPNFKCMQKGSGNLSIMMIGNSFVLNLGDRITTHFKGNFSTVRYQALLGNCGTYASLADQVHVETSRKQVEQHRPDVLFILARHSVSSKRPISENDEMIREMNENIAFYEKFAKRIYILGAHPLYNQNLLNSFLYYTAKKPDELENLHLEKKQAELEMVNVRRRFAKIQCKNCKVFELGQLFLDGNQYLSFDKHNMLSYIDNSMHLTPAGVKVCDPGLKSVVKEILMSH